jgi:regulatory protein
MGIEPGRAGDHPARRHRLYAVPPPGDAADPAADGSRPPEAEADPEEVARTICLRMLTARPCTRGELAAELRRRRVPVEAAATVLSRLDAVGLVDDKAFAATFVERQVRTRGLGRRGLTAELRRKGVADEEVAEAVAAVSDEEERARAAELVARKLPAMRHVDRDKQVSRLVGMLARKGYGPGVAYAVVRAALGEDEEA